MYLYCPECETVIKEDELIKLKSDDYVSRCPVCHNDYFKEVNKCPRCGEIIFDNMTFCKNCILKLKNDLKEFMEKYSFDEQEAMLL